MVTADIGLALAIMALSFALIAINTKKREIQFFFLMIFLLITHICLWSMSSIARTDGYTAVGDVLGTSLWITLTLSIFLSGLFVLTYFKEALERTFGFSKKDPGGDLDI